MKKILNIAAAVGFAALLSAPAYAVRTSYNPQTGITTTEGHITMMQRQGNMYLIQLDNGGYSYWLPVSTARADNLQVGEFVSLSGTGRADGMTVTIANPINTYGLPSGTQTGIVQSVNRHLHYITVRDQATGRMYKVDVRNMNTRQSVNVWRLRSGDRIVVNGGWENRDTFMADTVNF